MNSPKDADASRGDALPPRPNLEHLKREAKLRLKELRHGDPAAQLAAAQFAIARQYGFSSWRSLRAYLLKELSQPTREQAEVELVRRRYEQARPRQEIAIDPASLDLYVGHYDMVSWGIFTVTRDGDALFVKAVGQVAWPVFPEGEHCFFYKAFVAQITFITNGTRPATNLILHQMGYDQTAKRISEAAAADAARNLALRRKENTPWPGGETALLRIIDEQLRGEPDYDRLGDMLARAIHQQLPVARGFLKSLGPLLTVEFKGIGLDGTDIYATRFENGDLEWRLRLAPDGKIVSLTSRHFP